MLGKFNSFIEKWMAFVTPACLLMGVLFPDIAKHGVPYVTYAFAFMTFIGALKSRFRDVADVFKKPLPLILMLLVLHVLVPVIACGLGHLLFPQNMNYITGMVLEFSVPTAVISLMWVSIYNGNSPLSLSLVVIDTILAPFLIPVALKILVGSSVKMDTMGMMKELVFMIALPAVLAMCLNRIGAAVRKDSQFTLISGNQMGALLTYFLLSTGKDRLTPASTLVKTVVTGELAADIAESFHVQVVETLTGFKYIGEKITEWERNPAHDFVFGFEESYGYLAGTHARDKDAVVTAMLICEMAAYFKSLGKTLSDVLAELYETYGYYYDKSLSYTLKGLEGGRRIASIMEEARSLDMKSVIPETVETLDFEKGIGGLPRENVLKYRLAGGGWFAIRPSGTEPKIKFYYSLRGRNEEEALRLFGAYRSRLEKQFGL